MRAALYPQTRPNAIKTTAGWPGLAPPPNARFRLSKRIFSSHTDGMLAILNNLTLTARMAGHTLAYFGSRRWRQTSPIPNKACKIPADFFGLCVANAPDPASDDYVIAQMNELGIRHARLDFTYNDREAFTERFLSRLLSEHFRVCLHLVQPREEAFNMLRHPEAVERWRTFIGEMLDRYGSRVELIEIGSTCNRRKWAGYSPAAFFAAWQIAWEEARGRNLQIAGPNVTDFEPVYNAGWLGEMRRAGLLPGVHTDNLFAERATEPEAFDRKVAGRRLASLVRFNLVRKAQLLQDIGAWAGVPTLMCTHVAWSLRRIARFLEDVEEKQADYLGRYACLAAASGALARVYWGPLIGQREGLIDDGTLEYPELPHVTYYEQARGKIADYRRRQAFMTFRTVNRFLSGATFRRQLADGAGLEILEFEQQPKSAIENQESKIIHAVWATDGNGACADACYSPELLAQAEIYTRDGRQLARVPRMFSESPVFLVWPNRMMDDKRQATESGSQTPSSDFRILSVGSQQSSVIRHPIPGVRFARRPGWDFDMVRAATNPAGLAGVYLAEDGGERRDIQALIELCHGKPDGKTDSLPGKPTPAAELRQPACAPRMLRNARNVVWSAPAPWNAGQTIVIKVFKPRSFFRRLLDCGKPNKAWRSWNGAQELLRRGLNTPTPLACLTPSPAELQATHAGCGASAKCADTASYYICEAFTPACSARDAFTAFSSGATEFQGYSDNDWYGAIVSLLQKMHTRGVYFRDLSAGNLLARPKSAGEFEFALIDTARARFYPHSLGLRLRLCDLMRICHPLTWPNRRKFVKMYLAHNGRRFSWWMRIPFWYYDGKHRLKNALKKIRRTG